MTVDETTLGFETSPVASLLRPQKIFNRALHFPRSLTLLPTLLLERFLPIMRYFFVGCSPRVPGVSTSPVAVDVSRTQRVAGLALSPGEGPESGCIWCAADNAQLPMI